MSKPHKPDFRLVIESNKVDPARLSKTIRGYIRDYDAVEKGIEALLLQQTQEGKLDEDDQRELDEFKEAIIAKDKDLVKRINTWIANEGKYKDQGDRLRAGLLKKANLAKGLNADGSVPDGDPIVPPPPVQTEEQPVPVLPPVPGPNDPPPAPPVNPNVTPVPALKEGDEGYTPTEEIIVDEEEEKKRKQNNTFWGILGAIAVAGIAVLVGVKLKSK